MISVQTLKIVGWNELKNIIWWIHSLRVQVNSNLNKFKSEFCNLIILISDHFGLEFRPYQNSLLS